VLSSKRLFSFKILDNVIHEKEQMFFGPTLSRESFRMAFLLQLLCINPPNLYFTKTYLINKKPVDNIQQKRQQPTVAVPLI